jgi:2,5-diketo-D-gluconate reductase A
MATQPSINLNDGNIIPQLGFGVWQVPNAEAESVVGTAIAAGYRSIDTAAAYENEAGVGAALASTSVPRAELFITTKLWNEHHVYDVALREFDESLRRLKLEYIDLYLIHWPKPRADNYVQAWRALIKMKQEGRAKSIGVSNFTVPNLKRLSEETGITPSVNQIELHPWFQQTPLRAFHAQHGIITESWSPLGQGGKLLEDETVGTIAQKYGKTPAQVIIRWHLDSGLIVIPKSATPTRIRENFDVFDFSLDADELGAISKLDRVDGRIGPDPDTATF